MHAELASLFRETHTPAMERSTRAKARLIGALFVIFLMLANLVINREPVTFTFWIFWPVLQVEMAKTVLIIGSAVLGSLLTLAVQWYLRRSRQGGWSQMGRTA